MYIFLKSIQDSFAGAYCSWTSALPQQNKIVEVTELGNPLSGKYRFIILNPLLVINSWQCLPLTTPRVWAVWKHMMGEGLQRSPTEHSGHTNKVLVWGGGGVHPWHMLVRTTTSRSPGACSAGLLLLLLPPLLLPGLWADDTDISADGGASPWATLGSSDTAETATESRCWLVRLRGRADWRQAELRAPGTVGNVGLTWYNCH